MGNLFSRSNNNVNHVVDNHNSSSGENYEDRTCALFDQIGPMTREEAMEDALLVETKEEFAHHIVRRLQTKLSRSVFFSFEEWEDGCHVAAKLNPKELEAVVNILVHGEHIHIPYNGQYSYSIHNEITQFLSSMLCGTDTLRTEDMHVTHLDLQDSTVWYNNHDNNRALPYTRLHNSIENLTKLTELDIDPNVTAFPRDLTSLKDLKHLGIKITSAGMNGQQEMEGRRMIELQSLRILMLHFQQGSAPVPPYILRWLSNASFQSLFQLHFSFDVDTTQFLPGLLSVLDANKSMRQISELIIDLKDVAEKYSSLAFRRHFHEQTAQIVPYAIDVCPDLKVLCFKGEKRLAEMLCREAATRLEKGDFDKELTQSPYTYVQDFWLDIGNGETWEENGPWIQSVKRSILVFLKHFKRLTGIDDAIWKASGDSIDVHLSYLNNLNYGGGRVLIPNTLWYATDPKGDGAKDILGPNNPPRMECAPKPIPLSVWPIVIARINKDREKYTEEGYWNTCVDDPVSIYRMLRPNGSVLGPALEGILGSHANTQSMHTSKKRKLLELK
ncbi:MAG: hypothetical protein SGARI_001401 [Bacillariaceae sp.]